MNEGKEKVSAGSYSASNLFNSLIECGISAGVAAIVSDFAFFPVDTLKTNIQASKGRVRGLRGLRNLGISFRSMYSGLSCAMASSFPVNLSFFFAYEYMNSTLANLCKVCLRGSRQTEGEPHVSHHHLHLRCRNHINEHQEPLRSRKTKSAIPKNKQNPGNHEGYTE